MAQRQELQSEGRRDRAESGKNMMRRARPCGGCDDSEAGKTVWGRRDRAEAGETVWIQARLPHSQVSKAFTLGRDH